MDRLQILLKLGLDAMGVPVSTGNYQQICEAVYLAQKGGVSLTRFHMGLNKEGKAYCPKPLINRSEHLSMWLWEDVRDMEYELRSGGEDGSDRFKLDEDALKVLEEIAEGFRKGDYRLA